jgi:hypothetical protein
MTDRPPGREREGGPVSSPSRPAATPPPSHREVIHRVADGPVNQAVADKLLRLHWHYGYLTRAEIEDALGLDPPPGRWECAGQFGVNGRWSPCCTETAS